MAKKIAWATTTWLKDMKNSMEILQPLADEAGLEVRMDSCGLEFSEKEVIAGLENVVVALPSNDEYTERVFSAPAAASLKMVARTGVGLNSIDLQAATARGVVVTNAPTQNGDAVAEHTFALLLALAKNISAIDRKTRDGGWADIRDMTRPFKGKTLGILGLGNIGKRVARLAKAFGMEVVALDIVFDERFAAEVGVYYHSAEEVAARSDFVSNHIPLNEDTRGLVNRDFFSRMKPGAIFIHTSRGPVVNFDDLAEALRDGRVGGAGLDVFPGEPPDTAHPVFSRDNVVVTPHVAGVSEEGCEAGLRHAVHCALEFLAGRRPPSVVNPEVYDR